MCDEWLLRRQFQLEIIPQEACQALFDSILGTCPEEQARVLDRVLDEYGLIVCGWSADWDHALVHAIEGTRSRRYPLFWSHLGPLREAARRLTARHTATLVPGMTADEFFPDLVRRLEFDQTTGQVLDRASRRSAP